jgi:uncharacterized repeat protein (TIGR03803 family)
MKGLPMIRRVTRKSILLNGLALALVISFQPAHAAKFHVVYTFQGGTDASGPIGGVTKDGKYLYGTTYFGGDDNQGAVYKVARDGTESVVYSFTGGSDGGNPEAGLIADASGNLYGTTYSGGGVNRGTVFKITRRGHESVLYSFCPNYPHCSDGFDPSAGLIIDASGNLYGTTYAGGSNSLGTVFEVAPDGTETVLYSFAGGNDGADPAAAVIADSSGNLYGTTYNGGTAGFGTVFKLAANGTETVLYSFQGGSDGANPSASVIEDANGNLYGTTYYGGSSNCSGSGCGTVFKLAPDDTETVLYSFAGGSDGTYPEAGLTADTTGRLYGATLYGGTTDCSGNGCGTVFRLAHDGKKTILHAFTGGDGAQPSATLLPDGTDQLYGTTYNGGASCDCGVVYDLKE